MFIKWNRYFFKWSEIITIKIENNCSFECSMYLVLIRPQYNECRMWTYYDATLEEIV